MTVESRILSALKKHRNGLSKLGLAPYVGAGCGVGEYISRLRRKGYDIPCIMRDGVNRDGKKIRFGVYMLRTKR
jgi:hypothetical protein